MTSYSLLYITTSDGRREIHRKDKGEFERIFDLIRSLKVGVDPSIWDHNFLDICETGVADGLGQFYSETLRLPLAKDFKNSS